MRCVHGFMQQQCMVCYAHCTQFHAVAVYVARAVYTVSRSPVHGVACAVCTVSRSSSVWCGMRCVHSFTQ